MSLPFVHTGRGSAPRPAASPRSIVEEKKTGLMLSGQAGVFHHLATALRFDAGYSVSEGFIGDRHVVGIGVQNRFGIRDHGNMALPEQQIAAIVEVVGSRREMVPLQIAVAGAWDTAHLAGDLDKARAVDAKGGVSAPQVGRADQAFGNGDGVRFGRRQCTDVLHGHETVIETVQSHKAPIGLVWQAYPRKAASLTYHLEPTTKAEFPDMARLFHIGEGVKVGGSLTDHVRRLGRRCVIYVPSPDPSDIAVLFGHHKAIIFVVFQQRDTLAKEQLTVHTPEIHIRLWQKIHNRLDDNRALTFDKAGRRDLATQGNMRDARCGRRQPSVVHRSSA